jgi:TatA/E family protein of Tat protein translocase
VLSTIFSGPDDLIVIVVALVLLFGGSQLPKFARNAGEAMREFRKAGAELKLTEGSASQPVTTGAVDAPGEAPAQVPLPGAGVAPTSPPADATGPGSPSQAEERITLSRAELDALLAEREARARGEGAG